MRLEQRRMTAIFTIGVYGFTEAAFFTALKDHEIDLFIDIRARRGMRGAKYKFVNSSYLQAKLKEMGIGYAHLKELAPSPEMRATQGQADRQENIKKRQRIELSKPFIRAYKRDILKAYKRKPENKLKAKEAIVDKARQLAQYPPHRPLRHLALFCVEQHPQACHRSLVAEELKKQLGVKIKHIQS